MNTLEQRARALYERAMSEVAAAAKKAGQSEREPKQARRKKHKAPSNYGQMPRYSVVESFRKEKPAGEKKSKRAGAKPKKKSHVYGGKKG